MGKLSESNICFKTSVSVMFIFLDYLDINMKECGPLTV